MPNPHQELYVRVNLPHGKAYAAIYRDGQKRHYLKALKRTAGQAIAYGYRFTVRYERLKALSASQSEAVPASLAASQGS